MADIIPIFNTSTVELTTAQVIAQELKTLLIEGQSKLVAIHQEPFNKLWKRTAELGVDPQDVLDVLGTDGIKMFQYGGEFITFLLGGYGNQPIANIAPVDYTPPFTVTFSASGVNLIKP